MRQFKMQGRIIYLAESREASEHFVPDCNWEDYIQYRLNVPHLCHLYNTIDEAQQSAMKK